MQRYRLTIRKQYGRLVVYQRLGEILRQRIQTSGVAGGDYNGLHDDYFDLYFVTNKKRSIFASQKNENAVSNTKRRDTVYRHHPDCLFLCLLVVAHRTEAIRFL